MGLQWPPDLVEGNGSQENSLVEGCRKGKWSNPASANHRWLLIIQIQYYIATQMLCDVSQLHVELPNNNWNN